MGIFKDLTGKKVNSITVLKRIENKVVFNEKSNKNQTYAQYLCECICKKQFIRKTTSLLSGKFSSCGSPSCSKRYRELTGKRFGRWTVLNYIRHHKYKSSTCPIYLCICDCGTQREVKSYSLTEKGTKKSQSCGCLHREISKKKWKERAPFNKLLSGVANFNNIFASYKSSAKYRKLEFSLTKEQFKIITSSNCHYCGIEPNTKSLRTPAHKVQNGYYLYNGIDRIDSKIGYLLENTLPCCTKCNYAKGTDSYNGFLQHIKRISIHLKL